MSVEIDALTAKAISIVLEGLDAISEKLREANVGEYHVDDGLRLSIASLPQYEFRWRDDDSDYFVAVPLTGSVPPAAPPGGDGATTAGRAAVSRPAVEHEAGAE